MDLLRDFDTRDLVTHELAHGRELAEQLRKLLDPSSPQEQREFLLNQILSIYNKALNLINSKGVDDSLAPIPSPTSFHGGNSPQSSRSSIQPDGYQPRPSKKRKIAPRRTENVKVGNGEELPSDGYGWRKYGQKIILGAKFRRAYYRCTHQHSQGCLALKQVQKSDEDPTIFQVIYVGDHTCTPTMNPPRVTSETQTQQALPVLQPQLTVQTQGLDNGDQEKFYFRSFSFSTVFAASLATSNSDNLDCVWTPDSDTHEGFSAPNSGENSPTNKLEFTLEELGIDPNFSFDSSEMFS